MKKKVDIGKGCINKAIDTLKHTGEQALEKKKNRVHTRITRECTYHTWPRDWKRLRR